MIKTIIFDFGDIFINLDKPAIERELLKLGISKITKEMYYHAELYEKGFINTAYLTNYFCNKLSGVTKSNFINAWNAIFLNFPEYRFKFVERLSKEKRFTLILLSNTNELHINWVKEHIPFYNEFKNCFDAFYLSHEIQLRKPNTEVFQFVLQQNNLIAEECLFIDDTKEHIETASQLGFKTWNLKPATEDIVDLFKIKKEQF